MMDCITGKLRLLLEEENKLRVLDLMAGILIMLSPIIHLIIVKRTDVPYGRFTTTGWGPLVESRVAWFLQELPSLLVPCYVITTTDASIPLASAILTGLYLAHYCHRVFIYSYTIKGGKPTPLAIMLLAMIFCAYNGYMQTKYLVDHANYKDTWICEPNFIIGVCIFAWGMITNIRCDNILKNLRKPGETGYKIPQGSLFELVSCGNLLAEAVEWCGFAIACWSLQAAAFATFALLYLSAKSYSNHIWYLKKFDNYPKDRKIFIPYLI